MKLRLLLPLLIAPLANGQFPVVSNALGGVNFNVVAPRMLATITDATDSGNFLLTGFLSVNPPLPRIVTSSGHVFVRPAGSLFGPVEAGVVAVTTGNVPSITFEVPAGLPSGSAEIYWQIGSAPYRFMPVRVVPSSFYPSSEVRMQNADGTTSVSSRASPARPGQTILLTGTGLGSATTASATLAGLAARTIAAFHGPTSGYDTIQLEVPSGVAGCSLPLLVTVGDSISSNSVSVSLDGSPCPNPLSLSVAELKSFDSGAWLAAAQVDIASDLTVTSAQATSREETATVGAFQTTPAVLASSAPRALGCNDVTQTVSVWRDGVAVSPVNGVTSSGIPPRPPDLGTGLTLAGPLATWKFPGSGSYLSVRPAAPVDVPLAAPAALKFPPGKWTFATPGSPDLSPASVAFNLPGPLVLNGPAVPSIRRDRDTTFTWDGSVFPPSATVIMSLDGTTSSGAVFRQLSCTVSARSGALTIPAALLTPFDPASIGRLHASSGFDASPLLTSRLSLTNGSPLIVFVYYHSSDNRPVDFQ